MDALRVSANEQFQSVSFSEFWRPVKVLDTRNFNRKTDSVPWKKTYNHGELLDMVRLPEERHRVAELSGTDCVIVSIPSTSPNEFDCSRRLFLELFNCFGIEPSFLTFIRRGSAGAYHIRRIVDNKTGDYVDSYYFEAFTYWLVYSYHSKTRSTRGLIMPEHFTGDWNHDDNWVDHMDKNMATYFEQLNSASGLLFTCFIDAVDHAEQLRGAEFVKVKDVEANNGHVNIPALNVAPSSDDYTNWSRAMGRAMQRAISIKRQCQTMGNVLQILTPRDGKNQHPEFPWIDAVQVVALRLENLKHSLDCLIYRAKNQTAVLTNLLSREDSRASVELAEAAQRDSGAMKTVAVMTMLFLPATFFAAFFSMPLMEENKHEEGHSRIWVYWAFTVPCTIIIMLAWTIITYFQVIKLRIRLIWVAAKLSRKGLRTHTPLPIVEPPYRGLEKPTVGSVYGFKSIVTSAMPVYFPQKCNHRGGMSNKLLDIPY